MLQAFILHSKNDYRYSKFLSCFNYEDNNNTPFCLGLYLALNRAKERHLITGIFNGSAYVSKYFAVDRIIQSNPEFYSLMDGFVQGFDFYAYNPSLYLEANSDYQDSHQAEYDMSRTLFELQRRIQFEDKDEN